jgi:hypothetical protein
MLRGWLRCRNRWRIACGPLMMAGMSRSTPGIHEQEYARHNSHADLLRERIDGRVGQ